jgi:RNA polymerase sigma-70 factor (ECF subfamily)
MRAVDRAILLLCVFSALSNGQIASRLGVAEGTVRSRLSRMRAELRA